MAIDRRELPRSRLGVRTCPRPSEPRVAPVPSRILDPVSSACSVTSSVLSLADICVDCDQWTVWWWQTYSHNRKAQARPCPPVSSVTHGVETDSRNSGVNFKIELDSSSRDARRPSTISSVSIGSPVDLQVFVRCTFLSVLHRITCTGLQRIGRSAIGIGRRAELLVDLVFPTVLNCGVVRTHSEWRTFFLGFPPSGK